MKPAVGTRFGRYELLRKLGAGGMGEVYRARDHDLGRDVAIKFLPDRFASDPSRLDRFTTEARAASSLNHPNIVTVHEIGRVEDQPFLVMEFVEGSTLRDLLRRAPIPTTRALDLAVQAAEGLAKAHAAGIVHRDLKPENLMVTGDGLLKILDFGLAKLRVPHASDSEGRETFDGDAPTGAAIEAAPPTGVGTVLGTIGYMAPEQAAGQPVDFRADQFALGAILYEMASGRRAFARETPVQTLSAIIETDPEPLTALNAAFPAPARWVVERCLSKDPAGRYASTVDLAGELRAVRAHLSEVTASGTPGSTTRVPTGRWLRVIGAAAVVLAVVLGMPWWRTTLIDPLTRPALPADKRIAVLPFRALSDGDEDARLSDGLTEFVVARLGQIEHFQRAAWVVPSIEVRQAGASTPAAARRALGATIVVTGSLQRAGAGLVVTASLIDASTLRQLRATTLTVDPDEVSLLEATVDAVVSLLDVELGPDARAALHAGGSSVAAASTLYAQAIGSQPYTQARTALQRHDQEQSLEQAIELFSRALEQDPRYALAHAGLGEAYWRLSRFTRNVEHVTLAEQHCRRAIDLDPLVAKAWITLAVIRDGTGHPDEALDALARALDRDPRNAEAHRELANVFARLGRHDDAEATYRRAIELRPDDWVSHHRLGVYLIAQNQPSRAEASFRRALEIVPDNARVWSSLGTALFLDGRPADAEQAWQRSIELLPTSTAMSNLGTRQFFDGRYAEAARTFERAVAIDARDYRVWRNLAAARLWAPGEAARAREAFTRATELAEQELAIDPLNPETHADLADSYANLDQPAQARAAAAEAIRLGGERASVALSVGEAYERLGDRSAAIEWVVKAIGLGLPADVVEHAPGLSALRADPGFARRVTR